jgi:hypothetical protein
LHEKEVALMRRITLLVAVVAVMAAMLAVTASSALAQAQNETITLEEPFTGENINPCNGEFYTFEGTGRFVSHITYDDNGSPHHHFSISAVGKGVGEYGSRYVIPGTLSHNFNGVQFDPSAYEQSITSSTRVIRLGDHGTEEDFMIHLTWHITQNANGEFTADVVAVNIDCR